MSISGIYNFYCFKTIAKPFYRMKIISDQSRNSGSNQISFSNSDFNLKGYIIKNNRSILSQIEMQYKNNKIYERCLYYPSYINYDLSIFKNNLFDNKIQNVKNLKKDTIMNTDFWNSLSIENQTILNELYDKLDSIQIETENTK